MHGHDGKRRHVTWSQDPLFEEHPHPIWDTAVVLAIPGQPDESQEEIARIVGHLVVATGAIGAYPPSRNRRLHGGSTHNNRIVKLL
jgi:hypothetical protein